MIQIQQFNDLSHRRNDIKRRNSTQKGDVGNQLMIKRKENQKKHQRF